MPNLLVTKREELAKKRADLGAIFAEAGDDLDLSKVTKIDGDTAAKAAEIRRRNTELGELGKEVDELAELAGIATATKDAEAEDERIRRKAPRLPTGDAREPNDDERERVAVKSIGDLFVESEAFKSYDPTQKKGPTAEVDLDETFGRFVATHGIKAAMELYDEVSFKATLDTITGYTPQAVRIPTIITPGEMRPTVASLLPQGQTTAQAIPYMEETTTTNSAAETAEGAAKPESTLAFTEKTSPVRKIATFLPVTDELFADVPGMRSYVENRLRTFIIQREDGQLLNGNGTAPNLRGILNTSGIQTQAKGADPTPDAIYKAMTKIEVNAFLDASGVVMHPNDWQEIRLLRTADGIYIWGNPSEAGPERIWGLPVVKTTRITEGTGLVGAFRDGAQIFRRSEIAFAVSDSHSDFFQKNLLALRVEERLALVVFRPSGFCTVTGI
jgi:HK97 family phage major capsid protein